MYKTKPITKSFHHKDDHLRQQREQQRADRLMFGSDSDEDSSSGSLQELDFSYMSGQQEEYSIEHFIENLQGEHGECLQQETPEEQEEQSGDYYYCGGVSALQRINAQYMRRMGDQVNSAVACTIKFDSTVRVKFFSDQRPAAEVCSAQQYAISQQYQQTSDEDRMC